MITVVESTFQLEKSLSDKDRIIHELEQRFKAEQALTSTKAMLEEQTSKAKLQELKNQVFISGNLSIVEIGLKICWF